MHLNAALIIVMWWDFSGQPRPSMTPAPGWNRCHEILVLTASTLRVRVTSVSDLSARIQQADGELHATARHARQCACPGALVCSTFRAVFGRMISHTLARPRPCQRELIRVQSSRFTSGCQANFELLAENPALVGLAGRGDESQICVSRYLLKLALIPRRKSATQIARGFH